MQRRFADTMKEMEGLINEWSAPACHLEPAGGSTVLLAVSGGIDSMCLADLWLRSFGADSFAVAHCNFHLRGAESDGDEALVVKWAEENGVHMHRVDFDTTGYASENGLSVEMAARELRYKWFGELCQEHGYAAVVVAHHADDNAETLVLNMVRGAGLKGLAGMKPVSSLPVGVSSRECGANHEIPLLRPLLAFSRKQIEGHVFANKVPYREDSTNSSVEYRRNSIRHEVFPIFKRMNPSFVRTLNREMTYLTDASSIVEEWCREHVERVMDPDVGLLPLQDEKKCVGISIPRLLDIPQWRYLLYYMLEPYGFNSSVLESLENLLVSDRTVSGKRFESDGYVLRTERQSLVVVKKMTGQAGHDAAVIPDLIGDPFTPVRGAGTYSCNGSTYRVEVLERTPDMSLKPPEGVLIFDAAKLRFPFVLRRWRSGDWLVPFGMRGKKKVSDLFTDLKYDALQKAAAVMIVDTRSEGMAESQHVSAVVGVRIDDRYRVTSDTKIILRIAAL